MAHPAERDIVDVHLHGEVTAAYDQESSNVFGAVVESVHADSMYKYCRKR